MSTTELLAARTAFEKYAYEAGLDTSEHPTLHHYLNERTQERWRGWRAAWEDQCRRIAGCLV